MLDVRSYSATISSRLLGFRALHFCMHSDGTSEPLHGHHYALTVTVGGDLCEEGYVIDFTTLEDVVRQSCAPLDRKILLPQHNAAVDIHQLDSVVMVAPNDRVYRFPMSEVVVLPVYNTTTELLASHLTQQILESLNGRGYVVISLDVRLEESDGRSATVRLARSSR